MTAQKIWCIIKKKSGFGIVECYFVYMTIEVYMKLNELASIRSGLVLSRKMTTKESSSYQYRLLNLRSIRADGTIDLQQIDTYNATEALRTEYLSQPGDLVIRLTAPYTAVLISEDIAGMVISSNFVIVRIESDQLLPGYLYWLLNTAEEKHRIYENATSNMLGAVKAKYFMEYELDLIPVRKQQIISELNLLSQKEVRLLKELAQVKEKYYAYQIKQARKRM